MAKQGRPKGSGTKLKSGRRSSTAHRTLEQSRAQDERRLGNKKWVVKNRKQQKARDEYERKGKIEKGEDLHHKKPVSKGGGFDKGNLTPKKSSENRGHGMGRAGSSRRGKKTRARR